MFDLIREIGQTLRNNRLRTILTGLSVAWGIFMLIVLLGAARGVKNSFEENSAKQSTNVISFWNGRTSKAWRGFKEGRTISMKGADAGSLIHENSFVESVAPKASVDTATIATSRDVVRSGFEAVYPEAFDTENITMTYGRFINTPDIEASRRVMVLSEKNATVLFGSADKALGGTVRSLDLAWTVVGVYKHDWRSGNYAPYTTYKSVTGNSDDAYQLDIAIQGIKTEEEGEAAEEALRGTMSRRHNFDPTDHSALWSWNRFTSNIAVGKMMVILEIAVWVIGIFTLLSGIVGVSNIMFVSVRERTHEIGIRRAIGAKPRTILSQVLCESVAVTAIFGYIGVFLGMVVLQLLDFAIGDVEGFRNPTVDITIAIKVTLALILAGAAAGLFPALKAIKVKPVEALRDE